MPDRLAGYTSVGVISHALYGDVSKLRHQRTGELVAFKRMELASAAQHRSKLANRIVEDDAFAELQTNMRIRMLGGHANIVTLKDCWVDRKIAGMLCEYCAKGELLDVVNSRNAALTIPEALRYFHQILKGVSFLHAHGMAHRDLSLENVLVDANDVCKLTDFGMATTKRIAKATGVGKVLYMSPEAMRGHNAPYDAIQSDLWSLGVLLFTLLVGQYPFRAAVEDDQHFRLLDIFGVEFLLARFEFATGPEYDDIIDLLCCLLAIDPRHRASAASLLNHPSFDRIVDAVPDICPPPPPSSSSLSMDQDPLEASPRTKSRITPIFTLPSFTSTTGNNPPPVFGRSSQRRSSQLDALSAVKAERGSLVSSSVLYSSRHQPPKASLTRRALLCVMNHVFGSKREWTPALGCCVASR